MIEPYIENMGRYTASRMMTTMTARTQMMAGSQQTDGLLGLELSLVVVVVADHVQGVL